MDLAYSAHHAAFRDEVRAFLDAHGHTSPPPLQRGKPTPEAVAWQQKLIEHGYAARTIPKQYGGYGAQPDALEAHIIAEEFTRAGVRMGHDGDYRLVPTVLELGTEEQKQWLVPPTIRGEMLWCQGYSEPGSGSDLASLSTRAELDGRHIHAIGELDARRAAFASTAVGEECEWRLRNGGADEGENQYYRDAFEPQACGSPRKSHQLPVPGVQLLTLELSSRPWSEIIFCS